MPPPTPLPISSLLNTTLSITTTHTPPLTGVLTAYSPPASTIVLQTASNDIHILPISSITNLTVVAPPPAPLAEKFTDVGGVKVNRVDVGKVDNRLREAVRGEVEKKIAGEVGEGWGLYEALRRSFKVQWVGKKMIVADSVEISDPWTPESCRAIKDDAKSASSLNWIKKVVAGEREKLGLATKGG